MPNAPAARITDQVQHSEAKTFRRVGMGLGALVGIGIGAFLVVASGAVEVLSAGTLTPVAALGVYVGAALVVGGTAAATGAAVSNSAADMGKSHKEEDGPILTGVTTIYIGADRQMAAHAGSKVACKRHKHSPPDDVELVAQGSSTVLLGPGHDPAARIGDLGTCKFSIGQGCSSVVIGGKTTTRYKIVDGDDPEKALFNEIGKYGGYAALIGGALIAIPIAAAGSGLLMGLKTGAMLLGKGLAMSQGIAWAVNKIPNEELRDHVNTVVALVLPFVGHDKGPAEETPAGGSDPPAPANDNVPGGGRPPEPANDNNAATGKPPTPANDNVPGGGHPAEAANDNVPGDGPPEPANDNAPSGTGEVPPSGETAQQIGSHEGGAPEEALPDEASPSGSAEEAALPATEPPATEPPAPEAPPKSASEEPATEDKPATEDAAGNGTPEDPAAQIGEHEGGAPGDAPPDQAEDGTSAENSGKDAAAGESDPTVQTKDSPGGEEDAASKSDAEKVAETPEQRADRLKAAVKPRVDEVAAGKVPKKGNPCQSGILDTRTGEIFPGRNTTLAPETIHPLVLSRLNAYLERTNGVTPESAGNLLPNFEGGMHAELNALNDALNAREAANLGPVTEANLNEFVVHNAKTISASRMGDAMPRCANCLNISQGVQVTPEVQAAEVQRYGQDYLDGVAKDVQGP